MSKHGSTPQENIIPILPAIIVGMILLLVTIGSTLMLHPELSVLNQAVLIFYGIGGCGYIGLYYWAYTVRPRNPLYAWSNAVIAGVTLGALIYLVPQNIDLLIYSLVFITVLSTSVVSNRGHSYLVIAIITTFHGMHHYLNAIPPIEWIIHILFFVVALIIVETIQKVKSLSRVQMERLEIVNEISAQIGSTLETGELISLLNTALQNTLDADTYYLGTQKGDELQMQLFYDDGEYFEDIKYKLEGTLSGWIIKNQEPLFLPDLRKPLNLEGIEIVTVGKPKDSLSWMGVPMTGEFVHGLIVIASYRPNAFNRSDFELLINITQRAAFALDNTYQHALVEEETRLDSLTRVYNHGFFIKNLREQAETCLKQNQPLSLIMLDLDFFKQYNDTFGHAMGDEILVSLCKAIRNHIKQDDAVGRWGGEEFAVSLPNTTSAQAYQVAQRIRKTLAEFIFISNDHKFIPTPTVSMGIAGFPVETDDVTKLIDLADKRLYIAKERGRDQIESAPTSTPH